jgi:FtsH-binding integral membrane protein
MSYQPQSNNPYGYNVRVDEHGGMHDTSFNPNYTNANAAESGMPKNEIGFNDQTIRQAFVRKVFTLVSIMLGVVTIMSAIPHIYRDGDKYPIRDYVKKNFALYFLSMVTFFVVYFALLCCENVRRSHPTNLICTGILTLSIGFVTMVMTSVYTIDSVVLAFAITTLSCGGIVIFSMTTKRDITSMLGFAFIAGMVICLFGFFAIFWTMIFHTRTLYMVYAGLGTLLFMLYLAIDIQMIMGGRKFEIEPEEHIFAAIMLFMDIVQIFWFILSLVGDRS